MLLSQQFSLDMGVRYSPSLFTLAKSQGCRHVCQPRLSKGRPIDTVYLVGISVNSFLRTSTPLLKMFSNLSICNSRCVRMVIRGGYYVRRD